MAAREESKTRPLAGSPPALGRDVAVLATGRAIAETDVPGLCERVRLVLEGSDRGLVVCDVGAVVCPDAGTVDALARLQLTARQLGGEVRLLHASRELQELLALTGLADAVPLSPACAKLGLESGRQAEEREQPLGVEECVDPDDPAG